MWKFVCAFGMFFFVGGVAGVTNQSVAHFADATGMLVGAMVVGVVIGHIADRLSATRHES